MTRTDWRCSPPVGNGSGGRSATRKNCASVILRSTIRAVSDCYNGTANSKTMKIWKRAMNCGPTPGSRPPAIGARVTSSWSRFPAKKRPTITLSPIGCRTRCRRPGSRWTLRTEFFSRATSRSGAVQRALRRRGSVPATKRTGSG